MPIFGVSMPITGTVYIEVEAEDEESAVATACDQLTSENIQDWSEDSSQSSVDPLEA